jgi:hypothetical protein
LYVRVCSRDFHFLSYFAIVKIYYVHFIYDVTSCIQKRPESTHKGNTYWKFWLNFYYFLGGGGIFSAVLPYVCRLLQCKWNTQHRQ